MYLLSDTPQGIAAREKRRCSHCDQAASERGEHLKKKNYSEATIAAFLKYDKLTDISKEIGVTPQTAAKYRDDPVLQEMLSDRRMEFIKSATSRMQMFLDEGVQILQNIIRDKDVSPQTKINGIQILFNQCKIWTEQTDILERLKALEEAEKQ